MDALIETTLPDARQDRTTKLENNPQASTGNQKQGDFRYL